MIGTLLKLALCYEGIVQLSEINERFSLYSYARECCNASGKPLVTIGMKRNVFGHPSGDYTVDIDPAVLELKGGIWADERKIPFPDKFFGACFNSHTLEHLRNPQEVEDAVNESIRVADVSIFLCPSPYSIYATLFCPSHNLRLYFDNGVMKVKENEYRTGLGFACGDLEHRPIGQAMVATDIAPKVVALSNGFIIT